MIKILDHLRSRHLYSFQLLITFLEPRSPGLDDMPWLGFVYFKWGYITTSDRLEQQSTNPTVSPPPKPKDGLASLQSLRLTTSTPNPFQHAHNANKHSVHGSNNPTTPQAASANAPIITTAPTLTASTTTSTTIATGEHIPDTPTPQPTLHHFYNSCHNTRGDDVDNDFHLFNPTTGEHTHDVTSTTTLATPAPKQVV
ncbi:hypothetical protein SprV_0401558100 [Sparganum proliferum]